MSRRYDVLYRLKITPWDHDRVSERLKVFIAEWDSPPGQALDVGCGTGRDAVYLAQRGWKVTAVDAARQALSAAQQRADASAVEVDWVRGDVCRLDQLGIADAYDLVLDCGCFHDLSDAERDEWARGVTAVTGSGAELLVSALEPSRRGLGPRGATEADLLRHVGHAWEMRSSIRDLEGRAPWWLGGSRQWWYQLQPRP